VRGERQLVALGTVDQTDDLGAYRVHGLPPGDYLVSASVRSRENTFKGDLMTVATYFPGTTRAGEAQPITVRAGEDQLGIDIAAPPRAPGTTISGVVFNSSGAPASGAEIHLLDSGNLTMMIGAKGVFVTADASGRFTASNVRPGSYVLDVAGWERSPQDFERATVPIEVPATGVTGITITMIPHRPVRLTGSVVADSGSTLPQALEATLRAQTVGSPGGGQNVLTQGLGTTGRFTLDGLSGRYTLEIEVATPGWMLKRLEIDGRDATDSAVDFSGGASTATARVILTDRIAEVSGTVTLGGSDTRATVVIFPDDAAKWSYPSRFVKTARTGGDGRFTIAGLAEGRYRMVAVSYLEEDEAYDPAFLERMKRPATDLRLAEGEKRSVTLPLTRR
jgi:hypothetical protein